MAVVLTLTMSRWENHTRQYWAYGLNFESGIRLDDLLPAGGSSPADVFVRYGRFSEPSLTELVGPFEVFESLGRRIVVSENLMYVEWRQVGRFLIRSGTDVLVDPETGVSDHDLQPFLTGPVLAVLLHQRGQFVLHSSAVAIDGAAVLFLGSKGDGKSTLAAHLQVRGHQLISDDIVPVSFDGSDIVTFPGFPRIKLHEDTILAVGETPDRYPIVHKYVEKRSFKYTERVPKDAIKIRCIYVLSRASRIELESVPPSIAFMEFTKHSFVNRFLNAMNSRREHFNQCDRLVRSIPVMNLSRPHDFRAMNQVCNLLVDHVQQVGV